MAPQGLHILVVDDEPDVLEVTCRMLGRLGYVTVPAGSGGEAIEILQAEHFDVAVVGNHMPGIDGNAVRRFIEQNVPNVGVVMASGSFLRTTLHSASPAGPIYLPKPFCFSECSTRFSWRRPIGKQRVLMSVRCPMQTRGDP